MNRGIDPFEVIDAAKRLAGVVHRTPVLTWGELDRRAGQSLHFKCEHLQRVGAFKFRGASHAVMCLADDEAARGVVTHSSGNHGQALALAAQRRGIPVHVVVPGNASPTKVRAIEARGATVVRCEPTLASREAVAADVCESTGGILIPPYDHPHVIAGQGTAALELLEDVPDLDAIVVPVGGGGLLAGTCLAVQAMRSTARVFAGEPTGADDAARSLAAGTRLEPGPPDTIADGLRTGLGAWTWPIIRDRVERIVTVDDEVIVDAMRIVLEHAEQVIEPSAAVAVAVVLGDEFRAIDDLGRVGVILSGGNVGPSASPGITPPRVGSGGA